MKSKTLVLLVLALACGLGAAYLTAKMTQQQGPEQETVWLAVQDIKQGTVIKEPEKLFVATPFPKGMSKGAVEPDKMKDKILTRSIRASQFVVNDDLSSNLGIQPPPGTKAMSIKVRPDTAVAGFISPGSKVDVMALVREDSQSKPKVQIVLQNQLVLATDQQSIRQDGGGAVPQINTATLAVTPNDAMRLELALSRAGGEVRLLLRHADDEKKTNATKLDSLEGDDQGGTDATGAPIVPGVVNTVPTLLKAIVAKEDVMPGTTIDDPERFFAVKVVETLPEKAYTDRDMSKLKGYTIKVMAMKGNALTSKNFDANLGPSVSATAKPPQKHRMYIQNGGRAPTTTNYEDGNAVDGVPTPSSDPSAGAPAPVSPPPPPPSTDEPKPVTPNKPKET